MGGGGGHKGEAPPTPPQRHTNNHPMTHKKRGRGVDPRGGVTPPQGHIILLYALFSLGK